MADTQQPDPNAKTDGTKRMDMQRKLDKQAEERAAAAAAPAPTETAERQIVPADHSRFQEAHFKRTQYILDASTGTRPEDIAVPAFWAHLGERLRPWDEVMVRADDGLWFAHVIVLESGRNWARVHIQQVEHLTTAEVAITQADAMSPYDVTYRGPHNQWSVIRKSDRAVVHEGSQTAKAAVTWLEGRLKAER